jgi:NAD(P)-dependent dehydrogenase (short-subunit alcohol dehydrogenase family)
LALADCELAILTRSEEGSVIVGAGETIAIGAEPVPQVIDVAGAVVFLASPAAAFITGETIRVGGGVVM